MNKSQEITNLLKATLNKMTLEGIDRVVLQINVSPEELCRGNNIPSYYPNEALTQEELTLIEQQKEYEIVSLVTGRIRNVQVNKDAGVEVYHRSIGIELLPGHNKSYMTHGGVWTNISDFVNAAKKDPFITGNTVESLRGKIDEGIENFKEIVPQMKITELYRT